MAIPTKDNLYGYDANKILPIVTAVIIGISLIGHGIQNSRYKFWRVTFFMFYASLFFFFGWVMRAVSVQNPDSLALYMISTIFIYLAPPIYSAAEYNTLGRLMHYLPMHSIINPNRVVYIFVFLGSLVEVFTAIGASWIAAGNGRQDQDRLSSGATFMAVAVILQAVIELGFITMVGILHRRCSKANMLPCNVRTLFIMLYGTSILILIRCIFRAVETFELRDILASGQDNSNALMKREWPFYVLEAIPVALYTYWLNIIHPGRYLPHDQRQYLDFDGKTERMGPGWIHKRHWVMFIADPFDMIGMLTMKKRDAFYLRPSEWPETDNCFAQGRGSNAKPGEYVAIAKHESRV
ncbi:RTA1 like protein-domain-containing protein [Fusarium acuminatum]|uniref:RTA1 like protein-domain-containing protein n=1 Tax=Fusarium acuminatum TaxID=5515 RepID=A0ABZ2WML5_9HYPO